MADLPPDPLQRIIGGDFNKAQYIGEAGNQAFFDGYYKAAGASIGTNTQVDLFTLPQGAKAIRFSATWTAQGTGGVADFGWRYKSGAPGGGQDVFLNMATTATAGSANASFIPPAVTDAGSSGNASGVFDDDVIVYAVFTGVAMPAGMEVYAVVEGAYAGTQ